MSDNIYVKKMSLVDHVKSVDIKSFVKDIYTIKSSNNIDLALLTEALYDLDNMIGMNRFKKMVMDQVLYLLIFRQTTKTHPMMHTLITGGPGRGKTTVAKILARIWSSMNIIGKNKNKGSQIIPEPDLPNMMRNGNNPDIEIDSNNMINMILTVGTIENHMENMETVDNDIKKHLKRLGSVINKKCDQKTANAGKKSINKIIDDINELSIRFKHISDIAIKNMIMTTTKKPETDINNEPYVLASRSDFIGQWVGSTPHKTKSFLEKNRGKVIIIDEAYSLFPKDGDSFSMEALTIINTYASEYPEDYIFVFAGYDDLIQDGMLTAQPGLKRRIKWHFSIEDYTSKDLANIFILQCQKENISVDISFNELTNIFSENISKFPHFGGSTESLIHYCCLSFSRLNCDILFQIEKNINVVIDKDILKYGILQLSENYTKNNNDIIMSNMYV